MQIQNFNQPSPAPPGASVLHGAPAADGENSAGALADPAPGAGGPREQVEITLLKKRIEHLELVIETARSLMTSNQERLLRRLHDLPHELMSLTAALHRLDGDASSRVMNFDSSSQTEGHSRRVA